ncbi:hypothetical protein BUALT_Bualt01G0153000 [Buddleja alternifolia]|uniref:Uncharacterized protein n=1 Tax=Buddleja alternifolia TaxID=168488 RepID=A0AAV6YHS9_9LAMI|nr:hypothetical protein BUALT_Bualt01G0153000 [Buddleja alternifolia]
MLPSTCRKKKTVRSHETNVSSSPLLKSQDPGKFVSQLLCLCLYISLFSTYLCLLFAFHTPQNEVTHLATVKHRIQAPFVGETYALKIS